MSGSSATPWGLMPTGIVAVAVLRVVSITVTVPGFPLIRLVRDVERVGDRGDGDMARRRDTGDCGGDGVGTAVDHRHRDGTSSKFGT